MNRIVLIGVLGLCALFAGSNAQCRSSLTTVSGTHAPKEFCAGDLIFEDTFDHLDNKVWQHEITLAGGGNWEFQYYTNNRSNTYVEDGILNIAPTLLADETGNDFLYSGTYDINGGAPADECTDPQFYGCSRTGGPDNIINPIKSGRIRTVNSFSFKYGKVEVRAKLPSGDWLWPAIWMLPRYNQYAGWPASGEIDIMESRGNKNLMSGATSLGSDTVASTMHWGPNYYYNRYERTHWEKQNTAGYESDFHTYGVEWTASSINFFVDGENIGGVAPADGFWKYGDLDQTGVHNPWSRDATLMAPFDQEFYLLINLAVGGVAFFPDGATNGNGAKPWSNESPRASADFWEGRDQWLPTWTQPNLQVDYVRVWAI